MELFPKKYLVQIEKIVISTGVGKFRNESQFEQKILPEIVKELSLITGQKPAYTTARKSISGFKVRAGQLVGLKVTLRGKRMRDFLFRLINLVLPRVKDFRGIDLKSIDEKGCLNIGFREHYAFPEIDLEKSNVRFGLQVTIVPKVRNREKAIEIYKQIGMPLKI